MKKKTNEEYDIEVQVALEAYCALIRSSKAHPNKEGLASIAFEFATAFVKVGKNLGKL